MARALAAANRRIGVFAAIEFGAQSLDPRRLTGQPVEPRAHLRHLGLGNAPFGLDPCVIRGRLGQRQLGGTTRTFGIVGLGGDLRSARLVPLERRATLLQGAFEGRQRLGCIARKPVGLATILFQSHALPVEIGQTLFGCFQLG